MLMLTLTLTLIAEVDRIEGSSTGAQKQPFRFGAPSANAASAMQMIMSMNVALLLSCSPAFSTSRLDLDALLLQPGEYVARRP